MANQRLRLVTMLVLATALTAAVLIAAGLVEPSALTPTSGQRNLPPSWKHPLGTDWLGRDLAARTVHGMRLSLGIGIAAGLGATGVAVGVALVGGLGPRWVDHCASWLTDATLGLPQVVLSLLVSFAVGGGAAGVITAITVTGWPPLARLLRAEVLATRAAEFVEYSRAQGRSPLPHVLSALAPQTIVGAVIALPHAIVHESMLTFLGFGIEPTTPSVGIILSEGTRYLAHGQWWAVVGPIVMLVSFALVLDRAGDLARRLTHPVTRHT